MGGAGKTVPWYAINLPVVESEKIVIFYFDEF